MKSKLELSHTKKERLSICIHIVRMFVRIVSFASFDFLNLKHVLFNFDYTESSMKL